MKKYNYHYQYKQFKNQLSNSELTVAILGNSKQRCNRKRRGFETDMHKILFYLLTQTNVMYIICEYAEFETGRFMFEKVYQRFGELSLSNNLIISSKHKLSILQLKQRSKLFYKSWLMQLDELRCDAEHQKFKLEENEMWSDCAKRQMRQHSLELYQLSTRSLLRQFNRNNDEQFENYLPIDWLPLHSISIHIINCVQAALLKRLGR